MGVLGKLISPHETGSTGLSMAAMAKPGHWYSSKFSRPSYLDVAIRCVAKQESLGITDGWLIDTVWEVHGFWNSNYFSVHGNVSVIQLCWPIFGQYWDCESSCTWNQPLEIVPSVKMCTIKWCFNLILRCCSQYDRSSSHLTRVFDKFHTGRASYLPGRAASVPRTCTVHDMVKKPSFCNGFMRMDKLPYGLPFGSVFQR